MQHLFLIAQYKSKMIKISFSVDKIAIIDMSLYIFNHFNANLKHNQQQLKICNKIPVIMTICN